ncbi:MAG TPA: hypothetical protein PK191_10920 [Niabella sp.]|nr:hypothetical protein [Niabella sp.]HOZ96844.1 hypothetical protein [Niabella sp.]HQW15052.1 hypothetical protein [Niabella sp.]HQX20193.1 hypothetical protein [Niabella sp.]HRB08391.1 hypothetical protein [Niabella sp.]
MHELEPYYNWQHIYVSEEDERSPFFGAEHSQFEYTDTIYNYYIHPQWDFFGSRTLYLKVLMADYEEKYAVIELIGEWNDAVENDIMTLKRNVLEAFMGEGIIKFILIGENVLNFHSGDKDYYEELHEELSDLNGWIVALNMPESSQYEFRNAKIFQYIELMEIDNWRVYKPYHLYKKINEELAKRLL